MTTNTEKTANLEQSVRVIFLIATAVSVLSLGPIARLIWIGDLQIHTADRWVYVLSLTMLLSASMICLLVIVPNRIHLRWVAIWLTINAGLNALLLAVFTFAGGENAIISSLDLSDEFLVGYGLAWTSVMTILCFGAALVAHWVASNS